MQNLEQIMQYAKEFVENVTGTEITSMKFRAKYSPENIEKLKSAVCRAYNISTMELMRKGRYQDVVRPRQMFYYMAVERYGMRVIDAGRVFNHDHTTAIHSRNKVSDLLSIEDPETLDKIRLINEYLNN